MNLFREVISMLLSILVMYYVIYPIFQNFPLIGKRFGICLIVFIIPFLFIFFSKTYTAPFLTMISYMIVLIIIATILLNYEIIERYILDVRHVACNREHELLDNIFNEVKEQAQKIIENDNNLDISNINLYIQDSLQVNAYACGKATVIVTRGLLEFMSMNEIKSILAHEIGHIVYGDTIKQQCLTFITLPYFFLLVIIDKVFDFILVRTNKPNEHAFLSVFRYILIISVTIYLFFFKVLSGFNSRKQEYRADYFAIECGYKDEMIKALYTLYDMEISDKKQLLGRLVSTHPKTALRLEALENTEN